MDLRRLMSSFIQRYKNDVDYLGLRMVDERTTIRWIRNEKPEFDHIVSDIGIMIEVMKNGHMGYSATCQCSEEGLKDAFQKAVTQTERASIYKSFTFSPEVRGNQKGNYQSLRQKPLSELSTAVLSETLMKANRALNISPKIVTRRTEAHNIESEIFFLNSIGAEVSQQFNLVSIEARATAQEGLEYQSRTLNGWTSRSYQMGAEAFLNPEGLFKDCARVSEEALELVKASHCPNGKMDLILAPDQMLLQIHESIGHPLELDRILGDERNLAGWSFVKPNDFGQLQYGSPLMNVTFDPTMTQEYAAYGFDDAGMPAKKEYLIENGILQRGLGSSESQVRSGLKGVANFRAGSWSRAPIDRMANINLEQGTNTLEEMISSVEKGVLMRSNRSWSIDDYRHKFQFSCEYGQLINDGKIVGVVKNPNYRGTTLSLWRSLSMITRHSEAFGGPYCGKGEPSQFIRYGHASPYCLFKDVEVFGGIA